MVPGDPFIVGDSQVGGEDLVGGGAGSLVRQAYFRILNTPTITRRLVSIAAFGTSVEVQDVTVVLANADGALSGDYRGAAFTLTAYDPVTGWLLERGTFIVAANRRNRGTFTILGTSFDPGIPEDPIPKGVIDTATFPLAVDVGKVPTWLFGNVMNIPLLYVRDDQTESQFDYLVCRGAAAAITTVRRVTPGGADPFVTLGTGPDYLDGYIELEPFPGMAGVLKNGNLEGWAAGPAALPDTWLMAGTGITVAKNQTAGQFDEGAASASITRNGTTGGLSQDLMLNYPASLSWWRGRTITVNARVRATVANRTFMRIDEGGIASDSAMHSGSGLFELLAATITLSPTATAAAIQCLIVTADTTVQLDDVRVYLKAKSWEEVLRPDLYPGYTALRFFFRQDDASDALLQIVADVHGLQPERNPVRAARTMLSNVTHGLGRSVDAASFDQAEIDVAVDHLDLVIVDAPEVLLRFDDGSNATAAADASGHERHGAYHDRDTGVIEGLSNPTPTTIYDNGDGGFHSLAITYYVDLPYSPAFDPTADGVTMEIYYKPTAYNSTQCPIAEKTVGGGVNSGYLLYQEGGGFIAWRVIAGGVPYTVFVALSAADTAQWLHLVGVADGAGIFTLYVRRLSGTAEVTYRVAPGAYTGALATGDGVTYVARFGTGLAEAGNGQFDNFALYSHALDAARVAAHGTSRDLMLSDGASGVVSAKQAHYAPPYPSAVKLDYPLSPVVPSPLRHFRLGEASGTDMGDYEGAFPGGTYVGGPTLGVPGALNPRRGIRHGDTAVSFDNDITKYAKFPSVGGGGYDVLAYNDFTVVCWYKPDALVANSGIVEKTIGGVVNTQWLLFQQENLIFWRVKPSTIGFVHIVFTLTPEDVGRWMHLAASYSVDGDLTLYRNGVLMASTLGVFTTPIASGVGDLYVGKLGSSAYPCQGDIDELTLYGGQAIGANVGDLPPEFIARLFLAGTWFPGGLLVDAALTEARQAQDWLKQVCQLRGIRFGFTATGAITCTVDAAAPTTILLAARDGAGDGERTLHDCRDRQRPALNDAVRDLIVNYRRDLLKDTYLAQLVRPVSTRLDAQGTRIGRDRTVNLDVVWEHPAADRFACYLAALLVLDETVVVTLGPEARALREAMLVQLTDAAMDYAGDVLVTQEVTHVIDEPPEAVLREWDESIYTYSPGSFPVGAGP